MTQCARMSFVLFVFFGCTGDDVAASRSVPLSSSKPSDLVAGSVEQSVKRLGRGVKLTSQKISIVGFEDADGDGVLDTLDNCPRNSNPEQQDLDGDGAGDSCDQQPQQPNFALSGQLSVSERRASGDGHVLEGQVEDGQFRSSGSGYRLDGRIGR